MARRRLITTTVVTVAVVALLWLFFAPVQLGGAIVYTTTVGNSMAPRFHKGDLALVRPASTYKVGDVVLYRSPVLHRAVLHRLLLVQDGHYFFKGDNNSFVDPGYATRNELVGKLWLRVPRVGTALAWVARPAHAALVSALAAFVLLFGAFRGTVRRRRLEPPRRDGVRTRLRRGLHRPRRTPAFVAGVVALLLALVLVPVCFLSPPRKTVPWTGAYHNAGTFSYSASTKPSAAYPDGKVRTGQPLFLTVVENTKVSFAYRFQSRLPHRIKGTIVLRARVSSGGWHHTYTVQKLRRFSGDRAAIDASVNLRDLQTLVQQLAAEAGAVGGSYDVDLEPVVHVTGSVGGERVDSTFAPTLPYTLSQSVLEPDPPQGDTLPGAEYGQSSASAALEAVLHPTAAGSIAVAAANYVTIARYHLRVTTGRDLGLCLLLLGILGCLVGQFRRRRDVWSHERRIAYRYECVIVDVTSLPALPDVVEMADFEQLAALAQYSSRPILRERRRTGDLYAVEEGARRYTYRASAAIAPEEPAAPAPAATPRRRVSVGSLPARAAGLLVVFGITVAGATAFTAGNTVPSSNAGSSVQSASPSLMVPAACSSLGITHVVSGSGVFSTTQTHALVLGSSGADWIYDYGSYNCIVGGAGADIVFGASHDVCIANSNRSSQYYTCSKS